MDKCCSNIEYSSLSYRLYTPTRPQNYTLTQSQYPTIHLSMKFLSILIPVCSSLSLLSIDAEVLPSSNHFKVETIATSLEDAMEITILPNGEILIVERKGNLKYYSPTSGKVELIEKIDVSSGGERGLLGITADPNFMHNRWIYLYYSPNKEEVHRLSRFTYNKNKISDEKILLSIPHTRKPSCHEGGSLTFDGEGNLFLSTGDNTTPHKSEKYPPLDERDGNENINSQRTSSNTNDLRGKVIRIKPTKDGSYTIPAGNLFPQGTAKTRPEIYVMGCRNPWRISADQRTNTLYWGDVGPDAGKDGPRGPKGYCEINQTSTAGNYGWPYFIADHKAFSEYDFDTQKVGKPFNPKKPLNKSRYNTGLEELPPSTAPLWFEKRSCYCAGPVYYYSDYPNSPTKLPKALDRCLITYDWNNGNMQLTKIDQNNKMEWKEKFLDGKQFIHPSDVEMGLDGSMYVLEYGSKWRNNTDGKLKKITYSETKLEEKVIAKQDPRLAGIPLNHPATNLLTQSTCLSCHHSKEKSLGPSYAAVALRYEKVKDADKLLAQKILNGGAGAWGEIPMPAHPQFNEEQLSQMVDAILSVGISGHK